MAGEVEIKAISASNGVEVEVSWSWAWQLKMFQKCFENMFQKHVKSKSLKTCFQTFLKFLFDLKFFRAEKRVFEFVFRQN